MKKKSSSMPPVLMPLFVANLTKRRAKMELSQAQLGARAGYTVSMISMIERGEL